MRSKMLRGIAMVAGLLALAAFPAVARGQEEPMESDEAMEGDSMMEGDGMMEAEPMGDTQFEVTIEVLSDSPTPLAPVAWAVHEGANPFVAGAMGARLNGLEALAEDGDPSVAAETVSMLSEVASHGVANTPSGSDGPGPATPGTRYTFTATAHAGQKLSFATMYVQSNDLFYSPGEYGLVLFEMGAPVSTDVTETIVLYDAGTEVNEEPGSGPNQAPRQSGPDTGPDEMGTVAPVESTDTMYMYPATDAVIRVTVKPHESM